ncbi:hypothetical protein L7F22_041024 [Adiantum nelumboides]|nr:hypothetical protein [Adiantum nelumboides]
MERKGMQKQKTLHANSREKRQARIIKLNKVCFAHELHEDEFDRRRQQQGKASGSGNGDDEADYVLRRSGAGGGGGGGGVGVGADGQDGAGGDDDDGVADVRRHLLAHEGEGKNGSEDELPGVELRVCRDGHVWGLETDGESSSGYASEPLPRESGPVAMASSACGRRGQRRPSRSESLFAAAWGLGFVGHLRGAACQGHHTSSSLYGLLLCRS